MITRRNLFEAAAGAGIAAAVGPTVPLPPAVTRDAGVLTFAVLLHAARLLNDANVPRFNSAHYHMSLHPKQTEEVALDSLTMNATYRVRETAWSLMRHERRRESMGKRGHVTAAEVFARLAEGHDYPATVPLPSMDDGETWRDCASEGILMRRPLFGEVGQRGWPTATSTPAKTGNTA